MNRPDLRIPEHVPQPLGRYVAVRRAGAFGFVSGQFPIRDGRLVWRGAVGDTLTPKEGREAATLAALNALGQVRAATAAEWPRVRLVRLEGYVASAPGFLEQPAVLDGASEAFVALLGDRGLHARTAFAVPRLPSDAPVELVLTFFIDPERSEP